MLVGVFPRKAACDDKALPKRIFHERRIAVCVLQDDIAALGQIIEDRMARVCAVKHAVREPTAARQLTRDDLVRIIRNVIVSREGGRDTHAARKGIRDLTRAPTLIAGAVNEHTAILNILRKFPIERA